jgi:pyruvate dehydrogenase kinase 2/3/4
MLQAVSRRALQSAGQSNSLGKGCLRSLRKHRYLSSSTTPLTDIMDESTKRLLNEYAHEQQTSVSLQTLMRTGRGEYLHKTFLESQHNQDAHLATERVLIQVASFLRRELPVRLAHRIRDLETVYLFHDMPSALKVKELYTQSFLKLIEFPATIKTREDEERLAQLLEGIYERHAGVLVTMARAAYEFRDAIRNGTVQLWGSPSTTAASSRSNSSKDTADPIVSYEDLDELHQFLDRFYMARIGIRVLIGQYLALRQPPIDHYVGIICDNTSPYEVVLQAIDDATFMCTRKYGDSPEVIISGKKDLTFPYVPTHLHYILLELLKNSMRATVDWHGVDGDYPPIKVIIADGKENEDVVIKVSDEGGGIPRSNIRKIWSYLFTTADPDIQAGMIAFNEKLDHSIDSPLAGVYGFILFLCSLCKLNFACVILNSRLFFLLADF